MSAENNVDQSASAAAQAFMEEGNALFKATKFNDAIEKYTQAIKLYRDPHSFCYRASAYIHLKQYDLAIQDCQTALQLDDKCAKAYGKMGLALYYQHRYHASIDAHKAALALDPFYMLGDGFKNQMDTIQQNQLTEAKNYCSIKIGGNGGIAEFEQFMRDDIMLDTTIEMMEDPAIYKHLESTMVKFFDGDNSSNGGNFNELVNAGPTILQYMQQTNDQIIQRLRERLAAAPVEEENDNNASSPVNTAESYESLY